MSRDIELLEDTADSTANSQVSIDEQTHMTKVCHKTYPAYLVQSPVVNAESVPVHNTLECSCEAMGSIERF